MAAETLSNERPFTVRGVTSRGIFIDLEGQIIIFVSRERYRGPQIINLPYQAKTLDQIEVMATGFICPRSLQFSKPELMIDLSSANIFSSLDIWPQIDFVESMPTISHITDFLLKVKHNNKLPNELVDIAIQLLTDKASPGINIDRNLYSNVLALRGAIQQQDLHSLENGALSIAGRGRGLTPSGDDFLLGFNYGLYMVKNKLPDFSPPALDLITNIVKKRSTLISANLAACAGQGEVDERLGAAFHALLHPEIDSEITIEGVKSWGSSSGQDAAAGMAIFLSAIRQNIE